MEQIFEIRFDDLDDADASRLAQNLRADLQDEVPELSASVAKDRADTQDFGATLVLVLGTPVAAIIARALVQFLQRNSGARISISAAGEVVATNLDSKDAAKIAEAFSERFKANG